MTDPKTIITKEFSKEFVKMLEKIRPLNESEEEEIVNHLEEYGNQQFESYLNTWGGQND